MSGVRRENEMQSQRMGWGVTNGGESGYFNRKETGRRKLRAAPAGHFQRRETQEAAWLSSSDEPLLPETLALMTSPAAETLMLSVTVPVSPLALAKAG
jgi:hypothetical protein